MENDIFKSYLRGLLRGLKEIQKAEEQGDKETVNRLLDNLIKDTQKGIED